MPTGKPAVTIIAVGKLRESFWRDAEAEYSKRLGSYTTRLSITEIADEPTPDNASAAQETAIRAREGERIRAKIGERDFVIALDRTGRSMTSPAFANYLDRIMADGAASTVTFLIGGSLGLDPVTLARANLILSFGDFTFPHQLMRIVLLEQIYRACRISSGEPYHK